MIIAVAGKNNIAVSALEYLVNNYKEHEFVIVCNKTENGINGWQKSLRFFANKHNIKEVVLSDLYKHQNLIFLSLEFDQIVKTKLFKSKALYNIHFSLLPAYKGMYTSITPILNNEVSSGVTLHYIDDGIDTGDIISQRKFNININETSGSLYDKYINNAFILFKENIDLIINNPYKLIRKPQTIEESSYYSKKFLDFNKIQIDTKQTAMSIHNQVRAFNFRHYQLPEVNSSKIVGTKFTGIKSNGTAGTIIFENDQTIMIHTIDYDLVLIKDQFDILLKSCKEGKLDSIMKIANIETIVNDKDSNGWTALILATYNGHLDVVKYLISHGADPYCVNNNGTTLLMYAKDCFINTGKSDIFLFLFGLNLDLFQTDFFDKSLIDYCFDQDIHRIGSVDFSKF